VSKILKPYITKEIDRLKIILKKETLIVTIFLLLSLLKTSGGTSAGISCT